MVEKLSDEDRIVFETLSNPIAFSEIMFSDMENLSEFDENKFSEIRKYQYSFFSFESLFVEVEKLSKKENFKIKKGFGDVYAFGGRRTGKTHITILIDCLISFWHKTFKWGAISSVDATKVRGAMDKIVFALENHPILKSLGIHSIAHPAYRVTSKNGCLLESVNNNAEGKEPGKNWYQKHVDKSWEEESCVDGKTVIRCLIGDQKKQVLIKEIVDNKTKCFVESYNIENKLIEYKPIINFFKSEVFDYDTYKIEVERFGNKGRKELIVSQHQKLLTQDGYKPIEELTTEDVLYNPQEVKILKIDKVKKQRWTMYDVEVKDNHNFFANGLIISNSFISD